MALRELFESLGRWNARLGRLKVRASVIQFGMILYMFLQSEPFGLAWWLWFVSMTISALVVIWVDIRMGIMAGELDYFVNKTPT